MHLELPVIAESVYPQLVEEPVCPNDARLTGILDTHLGLSKLLPRTRHAVLTTVCRGLQVIEGSAAKAWLACLESVAASGQWQAAVEVPKPHGILETLAQQPSPGFTRAIQEQCCSAGARAFLVAGFQLRALTKEFAHGLAQLYANKGESWSMLRAQLATGELHVDIELGNGAAETFRAQLRRLIATRLAAPTTQVGVQAPLVPIPAAADPNTESVATVEEVDDVSPAWDLFERQVQRCMQTDETDGNRLSVSWNRLTASECKRVFARTRKGFGAYAKDKAQFRRAVYAAIRELSFFACIPMRACFRMPLAIGGDMYLDLVRGCVVRDWSKAVPGRMRPKHMERRIETIVQLTDAALAIFRELAARHPEAQTAGELIQREGITLRMIGQALNTDWPTSHRPEDARFASSWPAVLMELNVHPAVAARLTGQATLTPITDHVYLAISDKLLEAALRQTWDFLNLTGGEMPGPHQVRGSAKYRSIDQLRLLVEALRQKVHAARQKITARSSLLEVICFHNLFTIVVALFIEWMHGTRCSKPERRTVEALVGDAMYLCVSDKKTDLYGRVRILAKTDLCGQLLYAYCEHLVSMAGWLKRREHPAAKQIERVSSGRLPRSPLFLLIETAGPNNRGYRNLRHKDLKTLFLEVAASCGLQVNEDDLNCFRHYFYSEFVARDVWQPAIDSMLGHHTVGAEPHGFFAGISLREMADFTRPILAALQKDLGFGPLVGLGRTDERYQRAPDQIVDRRIEPLPNQYLLRKLKDDEELVADFFARQQDPPATLQTLRMHALVARLKSSYVQSAAVAKYPAGGVLFCLVVFDGVLVPVELRTLYEAVRAAKPMRAGMHAIAQSEKDGGYVQRSISHDTLAAWALLERRGEAPPVETAVQQLHELVRELYRGWPATTATETLTLLTRATSHWAAIEIAPGTMFGAYHKAPIVPVHHLARIAEQRPCPIDSAARIAYPVRRLASYSMFSAPRDVIAEWAKKSVNLGEAAHRRTKCREELLALLDDATRDPYERELINQVAADLSEEPPYRRLDVSTLQSRFSKYEYVYGVFQRENTFELDWECFVELMDEFGGADAAGESDTPRWVLLHIAAYLTSRGYAHCLHGIQQRAVKFALPARNPVYVTHREVALVCADLPGHLLGLGADSESSLTRLQFERAVPSRHSDVRYMRACDFDEDAGLAHFASSGHAHLKGGKHGSWTVPPSMLPQLAQLKRRKLELHQCKETLLFGDLRSATASDSFDVVGAATRQQIVLATGCPQYRRHDLRGAALTDICLGATVDEMLEAPWQSADAGQLSGAELQRKHLRFYMAQRAARHASAHTACRHYNVGGVLDMRREFDLADRRLVRGPRYLAAVMDAPERKRSEQNFATWARDLVGTLAIPPLSDTRPPSDTTSGEEMAVPPAANLVHAAILHVFGVSTSSIAVATQLSVQVVERAITKLESVLEGLRLRWWMTVKVKVFDPRATPGVPHLSEIAQRYADWLTDAKRIGQLKRLAAVLLAAVDGYAQALRFSNEDDLFEVLDAMGDLPGTGISAYLCSFPKERAAFPALYSSRVTLVDQFDGAPHMTLRFLTTANGVPARETLERVSPRTLGVAGRIAVVGLIAAITY